jgi:hypothetical protein
MPFEDALPTMTFNHPLPTTGTVLYDPTSVMYKTVPCNQEIPLQIAPATTLTMEINGDMRLCVATVQPKIFVLQSPEQLSVTSSDIADSEYHPIQSATYLHHAGGSRCYVFESMFLGLDRACYTPIKLYSTSLNQGVASNEIFVSTPCLSTTPIVPIAIPLLTTPTINVDVTNDGVVNSLDNFLAWRVAMKIVPPMPRFTALSETIQLTFPSSPVGTLPNIMLLYEIEMLTSTDTDFGADKLAIWACVSVSLRKLCFVQCAPPALVTQCYRHPHATKMWYVLGLDEYFIGRRNNAFILTDGQSVSLGLHPILTFSDSSSSNTFPAWAIVVVVLGTVVVILAITVYCLCRRRKPALSPESVPMMAFITREYAWE